MTSSPHDMEMNRPATAEVPAGPQEARPRHHAQPSQPYLDLDTRPAFGMVERKSGGFKWKQRYTAAKPDPWIQMKLGVGVLIALLIWSFYVVVGRICAPIIQRKSSSGLNRATGAGLLVGFVLVWLMCSWTYLRIITTGPGFARDRIPKSPPPTINQPTHHLADPPTSPLPPRPGALPPPHSVPPARPYDDTITDATEPDPSEFATVANIIHEGLHRANSRRLSSSATLAPDSAPEGKVSTGKSKVKDWREIQRPVPRVDTGPRWCRFCEINKPDRTHHCRHCGTCVMQFDHHCLWIGQCVGWANHKFFLTFCFWGMLFNFYTMATGVTYLAKSPSIDGQVIGAIAVCAMLGLFTLMMLISHIHLILTGRSTVESFHGRDQSEREASILQAEYGYLWHNQEKRKVQRRWQEEWGGVSVDSRWKWGSATELWKQEMGNSWTGWILPIGRPLGDGIVFPQNPRFGPYGEWLQKKDWPAGVQ